MTSKNRNLQNEYNNVKLSQIVSNDPDADWEKFLL